MQWHRRSCYLVFSVVIIGSFDGAYKMNLLLGEGLSHEDDSWNGVNRCHRELSGRWDVC